VGEDAELSARLPNCCPRGLSEQTPCDIKFHHNRERKTGPCFPLHIVRCAVHKKAFTLYPPGHVPYGRQALVAFVAPDGCFVRLENDDVLSAFEETAFDAAIDAANDRAWVKECHEDYEQGRFNTQLRKIVRAIQVLGLVPAQKPQQEALTEILNIPNQVHHDSAVVIQQSPSYQQAGQAIGRILKMLSPVRAYEQLAISGHLAGLWPPLHWWRAEIGEYGRLIAADNHAKSALPP